MLLLLCQEVQISQSCNRGQPEPGTVVVRIYVQGHDVALGKLPSQVAAVVPGEQLAQALSAASLSAKGARFVNFADLAGLEALQVGHASANPMSKYCCGECTILTPFMHIASALGMTDGRQSLSRDTVQHQKWLLSQ